MRSWRTALCVVGLLGICIGASWGHVHRYSTLSPIDELQHLDYVIRIGHGHLVVMGDRFDQESLRLESCHRLDAEFDAKVPDCVVGVGVVLDPTRFQEDGYNTAAIHPPTYYAIDNVVARLLDRVLPGDQDVLVAARLVSGLWLAAGIVLLWFLLRSVGADRLLAFALAAAIAVSPTVLHASATVTNDATSILVGTAMVFSVLRWERRSLPLWVQAAIAALAAATKVTNLLAVALVLVYLVVRVLIADPGTDTDVRRRLRRFTERDRRVSVGIAAIGGSAGVVALGWAAASSLMGRLSSDQIPMVQRFSVDRFPMNGFIDSWMQTISPLSGGYLAPFLRSDAYLLCTGVFAVGLLGAVVAAAIRSETGSAARALSISLLWTLVLAGPALVLFNYVVQGIYVVIPMRYGIALVPAMAVAAVPVLERRILRWATVVLAAGCVMSVAWALL